MMGELFAPLDSTSGSFCYRVQRTRSCGTGVFTRQSDDAMKGG